MPKRLDDDDRQYKLVTMRLSPAAYRTIQAAAAEVDETLSGFARLAAIRAARAVIARAD